MQRFRGGLVFKAKRLLYHSTLGLGVIKKKSMGGYRGEDPEVGGGDARVLLGDLLEPLPRLINSN